MSSSAAICQPGVDLQCPCAHCCLSLPAWEDTSGVFLFWDTLMVLGQETLLAGNGYTKTLNSFCLQHSFCLWDLFPSHSDLKVPPKEKSAWRHLKSPHPTTCNWRNMMNQESHSKISNLVKPLFFRSYIHTANTGRVGPNLFLIFNYVLLIYLTCKKQPHME